MRKSQSTELMTSDLSNTHKVLKGANLHLHICFTLEALS